MFPEGNRRDWEELTAVGGLVGGWVHRWAGGWVGGTSWQLLMGDPTSVPPRLKPPGRSTALTAILQLQRRA